MKVSWDAALYYVIMKNWFERYRRMERFAEGSPSYKRVKAQDYIRLMRMVEKKPVGFPATSDMVRLLDKMVVDLEDAVANVYINTIAAGHTANRMMYPCPDCNGPISTLEEIEDAWENGQMLEHYWNVNEYLESEYYGEDIEDLPDEIRAAFEGQARPQFGDGGDGLFICRSCGLMKTQDDLDEYMRNPFPGGRDVLISDQIDYIVNYLKKVKNADTFERKFPYFEGIIEWVHGSGDMSHWFIEGGDTTIDKYRNSKLPQREGEYGEWVHPHNRDKDWDWSKI